MEQTAVATQPRPTPRYKVYNMFFLILQKDGVEVLCLWAQYQYSSGEYMEIL
jgi:hypothetical protein